MTAHICMGCEIREQNSSMIDKIDELHHVLFPNNIWFKAEDAFGITGQQIYKLLLLFDAPNDKLIGLSIIKENSIYSFGIDEKYRNKGLGKKLMKETMQYFHQQLI
eukprot:392569_1